MRRRGGLLLLAALVALAAAGPELVGPAGPPAAAVGAAQLLPPMSRVDDVRLTGGGFLRAVAIEVTSAGVSVEAGNGARRLLPLAPEGTVRARRLWLGTDHQGRDVWARTVRGARVSLAVAVVAGALAMGLGTVFGLVACLAPTWIRRALEIVNDALLALPRLLLLLMAGLWIGARGGTLAIAIGAVSWMTVSRLVQAEGRSLMGHAFFQAARGQGAGRARLALRHLLPNLAPLLSVQAALVATEAILLEATLSFIGVAGSHPLSWGRIVADGQRLAPGGWWIVTFPGLLLFATAVALQRSAGDARSDSLIPPV